MKTEKTNRKDDSLGAEVGGRVSICQLEAHNKQVGDWMHCVEDWMICMDDWMHCMDSIM